MNKTTKNAIALSGAFVAAGAAAVLHAPLVIIAIVPVATYFGIRWMLRGEAKKSDENATVKKRIEDTRGHLREIQKKAVRLRRASGTELDAVAEVALKLCCEVEQVLQILEEEPAKLESVGLEFQAVGAIAGSMEGLVTQLRNNLRGPGFSDSLNYTRETIQILITRFGELRLELHQREILTGRAQTQAARIVAERIHEYELRSAAVPEENDDRQPPQAQAQ